MFRIGVFVISGGVFLKRLVMIYVLVNKEILM